MKTQEFLPLLAIFPSALANKLFGTTQLLGQKSEHELITRAALACQGAWKSDGSCFEPISINQLAGNKGTFGAVGAPDVPPSYDQQAHCDDADFLATPGYPQSRQQASDALTGCITYMKRSFKDGIDDAKDLLDNSGKVKAQVYYDLNSFWASTCTFRPAKKGRAKCDVIQGFGIALHGTQDFYSHSNWGDVVDPPYTIGNPPGLGKTDVSDLLNLRPSAPAIDIPYNLTTGCYQLGFDDPPASTFSTCYGRIIHATLNKDKGTIDPSSGATSNPITPRGKMGSNFQNAVSLTIQDTRKQWKDFTLELKARYGDAKGTKMICVLTRDQPWKTCK